MNKAYYNCILHRNCGNLRFLLCVWLAFVLMLMVPHRPETTIICMVSFLARRKTLATLQVFARKLLLENTLGGIALQPRIVLLVVSSPLSLQGNVLEGLAVKDRPILGVVLRLHIHPAAGSIRHLLQESVGKGLVCASMASVSAGNWAAKPTGTQGPDATDMSENVLDSQSLDGAKGALAEGTLSGEAGTVTFYSTPEAAHQ